MEQMRFQRQASNRLLVTTLLVVTGGLMPRSGVAEEGGFPIPQVPVQLTIKGESRGRAFQCVIDTGAPRTHIASEAAHLYGSLIETLPSKDGSPPINICEGAPMSLGGHRLPISTVWVTSFGGLRRSTGLPLEAIIGVQHLRFSRLWVNHSTGQLKFASLAQAEETQTWKSVPMVEPVYRVHVMLPLEGETLNFLLDTGSNAALSLDDKLFQHLVEQKVIETSEGRSVTFDVHGKKKIDSAGVFRKGEFMGLPLAGHRVSSGALNWIGLKWLFQFDCLFDFPASQFRFHPRASTPNPVEMGLLLGVALTFGGENHEAVVDTIAESSALAKTGIKQGDKILKFGSLEAADINAISLSEYVQALPPEGVSITIRGKADGQVREVKVKFVELPRIRSTEASNMSHIESIP